MKLKTILFLFLAQNSLDFFFFSVPCCPIVMLVSFDVTIPSLYVVPSCIKKMGMGKRAFFTFGEYPKTRVESIFLIS